MALQRLDVRGLGDRLDEVLPRPAPVESWPSRWRRSSPRSARRGDAALRTLTARFDGVEIDDIAVDPQEMKAALERIPERLRDALEVAHRRIADYHRATPRTRCRSSSDGNLDHRARATGRPGGLLRPRRAGPISVDGAHVRDAGAGRRRRRGGAVRAARARRPHRRRHRSPPPPSPGSTRSSGSAAPRRSRRWRTGPSRSGGSTCIVGPGNRYVAEAMRQVAGVVGVPAAFAGPSEVLVVAGPETAGRTGRHGPRRPGRARPRRAGLAGQLVRATSSMRWTRRWTGSSPPRPGGPSSRRRSPRAATPAWSTGPKQAMAVANVVAPEHLELMVDDARRLLDARAVGRGGVPRTVVPGLARGLRGRPQPRAADEPLGPLRLRALDARLPAPHPRRRGEPRRARRARTPRGGAGRRPRASTRTPVRSRAGDEPARAARATTSLRSTATTRPRSPPRCGSTPTNRRCRPRGLARRVRGRDRPRSRPTATPTATPRRCAARWPSSTASTPPRCSAPTARTRCSSASCSRSAAPDGRRPPSSRPTRCTASSPA